jgi:Heterokaryon incompatibility protein (HET)
MHTQVHFQLGLMQYCINQSDNAEKATQVAKMHNIYRQARCVFVQLGNEQDSSDVAMDAIKAASLIDVLGLPENTDEALIATLQHKSNTPILFKKSAFGPVPRLSDRAWFCLLWIAQEYFYARDLVFYCGRKVVDGSAFTRVLRQLSINSFGRTQPPAFHDEDQNNLFYIVCSSTFTVSKATKGSKTSFTLCK